MGALLKNGIPATANGSVAVVEEDGVPMEAVKEEVRRVKVDLL